MSMTTQFFDALGSHAGTPDRPFVNANDIARELGMNDTDLIAAIEALEKGNLAEDVNRGDMIDVRLTEQGREIWKRQHG
ncbi:MAG: hypothetical protein ACR2M3_17690 [Thermomicrobiales bacterium]